MRFCWMLYIFVSFHGICFARSCLAISKNSWMKSIDDLLDIKLELGLVKNGLLIVNFLEYRIKFECFEYISIRFKSLFRSSIQLNLYLLFIHDKVITNVLEANFYIRCENWSHSNCHLNSCSSREFTRLKL